MKEFFINNRKIGENSPIFLIAEVGVNHNGKLSIAKKLIDIASNSKVDAIKFQTFKAEKLMLETTLKADYQKKNLNDNENFYEMIKKFELSKEDFQELKDYCEKKEIIFLSTPFDDISVELLDEMGVSAFKIGSGDMNNLPLLELICSKRKPVLLSSGMATLEELKESVNFIKSNGVKKIVIFQCTTNYPASYEEVNLNVIETFLLEFPDLIIGFSDHSIGIESSIGAAAKGVKVIEKHLTLDKNMEGPDHQASMDPKDLENWVRSIRNLEKSLGSYEKTPSKNELDIAKIARKSIVSIKTINKGQILTRKNISIKRPGIGIPPKYYYEIIGKKVIKSISKDSILKWEDFE